MASDDERKYQLTLTEKQAGVLMHALEVFARIGIGQFRDALECLPRERDGQDRYAWANWHNDMHEIGIILSKHTKKGVDGWHSSLSICSQEVSEPARIAWETYQVIRHRLSWERAVAEGVVPSINSPRKWPEMFGVNFDEPLKISDEPLAKIHSVEE